MSPDYMRSSRERYKNPRALIASSRSVAFQEAAPFARSAAGEETAVHVGVLWRSGESECRLRNRRWLGSAVHDHFSTIRQGNPVQPDFVGSLFGGIAGDGDRVAEFQRVAGPSIAAHPRGPARNRVPVLGASTRIVYVEIDQGMGIHPVHFCDRSFKSYSLG